MLVWYVVLLTWPLVSATGTEKTICKPSLKIVWVSRISPLICWNRTHQVWLDCLWVWLKSACEVVKHIPGYNRRALKHGVSFKMADLTLDLAFTFKLNWMHHMWPVLELDLVLNECQCETHFKVTWLILPVVIRSSQRLCWKCVSTLDRGACVLLLRIE